MWVKFLKETDAGKKSNYCLRLWLQKQLLLSQLLLSYSSISSVAILGTTDCVQNIKARLFCQFCAVITELCILYAAVIVT